MDKITKKKKNDLGVNLTKHRDDLCDKMTQCG